MLFRFFLILLFTMSCGQKSSSIKYGSMTKAALIAEKGAPLSTDRPIPKTEILLYPNNQKYQVNGDKVTASLRDPLPEEKTLLYWRHQFKNCQTTFTEMNKSKDHTFASKELSCAKSGVSVVYDPNVDQVVRVVEYAKE